MVAYLRDREKHPERYFYPNQRVNGEHEPKRKHRRIKDRPSKYQLQALTDSDYAQACQEAVENCPDVMTIEQARRIILCVVKNGVERYISILIQNHACSKG